MSNLFNFILPIVGLFWLVTGFFMFARRPRLATSKNPSPTDDDADNTAKHASKTAATRKRSRAAGIFWMVLGVVFLWGSGFRVGIAPPVPQATADREDSLDTIVTLSLIHI